MPSEKSKSKSKATAKATAPPAPPTPLPVISQPPPPTTNSIQVPLPLQAAITTTTRIEFVPVFESSTSINYDQHRPKALPPTLEMCFPSPPSASSTSSSSTSKDNEASSPKAEKQSKPATEEKAKPQPPTSKEVPESKIASPEAVKKGGASSEPTRPVRPGFTVESERVKLGLGKSWYTGPKIDPNWRDRVKKTKH